MGTIRVTLGGSAKIGPVIEGRFHVAFPQCAQECAHAVVTIGLRRIVEPVALQGVSGTAAVFQAGIIVNSPLLRNICRIRKCLRIVYLQVRGEVAEWLKAAVC